MDVGILFSAALKHAKPVYKLYHWYKLLHGMHYFMTDKRVCFTEIFFSQMQCRFISSHSNGFSCEVNLLLMVCEIAIYYNKEFYQSEHMCQKWGGYGLL